MAKHAVTMEESWNPSSANIFSRTQDLRAATSMIEQAMLNLFTHVSIAPSSSFKFGSAKKNTLHDHDSAAKNLEMVQ